MPNLKKFTVDIYNKIAEDFNRTYFGSDYWKKEFNIFCKLVKGKKVIDIGCGAGRDAVLFARNKFDYLGIDASAGMLKQARQRVKNGKFKKMDFYKLSLPKESFDCFWACAALLRVPKKRVDKVLKNIHNILKPNTVGFISLKSKKKVSEGIIKEFRHGINLKRFFAYYTKKEFEKVLSKNGFKLLRFHILKEKGENKWDCYFVQKV